MTSVSVMSVCRLCFVHMGRHFNMNKAQVRSKVTASREASAPFAGSHQPPWPILTEITVYIISQTKQGHLTTSSMTQASMTHRVTASCYSDSAC